MLDVFQASAFTMVNQTARLEDMPHQPRRLAQLGLFQEDGIATTQLTVERRENTLFLVPTSPRGGPGTQNSRDGRNIRVFPTYRIAPEDTISADEVQNVRQFGTDDVLESYQAEVDRRVARMDASIAATEEFYRVNAIKGILLDADGSSLLNLFTEFGVSAQTEQDFAMATGDSPADDGSLRRKCTAIIRLIETELGGLPYTGIHGLCSPEFFDDLIAHPEVRNSVKNWPGAMELRERFGGQQVRVLDFGGIEFEEYTGTVSGTRYVAADKAHFVPRGVPELFISRYAPAEYIDTVNTVGRPRYVVPNPDGTDPKHHQTWRVQSQMIHLCTRPRTLVPAKRT